MNKKIWQTDNQSLHPLVESFTVGSDYLLDMKLLPYDVEASKAHAKMLQKIGVLSDKELKEAIDGLNEILKLWKNGKFQIKPSQEDGHTAIEQYLTENYGEIGKKIHTGRSRNDQSLVMIRLFSKDKLDEISNLAKKLIISWQKRELEFKKVPMPGYTHMQKAMPTTAGLWLNMFRQAFADFELSLKATSKLIDQNPLGSASGFGIENFNLDRKYTTELLNFSKVQDNPLYCGFSRGYFENIILQTLSQIMIISAKFAQDMLLFTTSEFNFFSLPSNFTTGSSIMPQKRNYDLFEIMRGNVKVFSAYQMEIQSIISSIGTGYQRDLQLTKEPFVKGVQLCEDTINLLIKIIKSLQIHEKELKKAMSADLFVTNKVYDLVNQGKSFREAYMEVKNNLIK